MSCLGAVPHVMNGLDMICLVHSYVSGWSFHAPRKSSTVLQFRVFGYNMFATPCPLSSDLVRWVLHMGVAHGLLAHGLVLSVRREGMALAWEYGVWQHLTILQQHVANWATLPRHALCPLHFP